MQLRKTRWSKVYESSEEELTAFLRSRGIDAERIFSDDLENDTVQPAQPYAVSLWCAEGSIVILVGEQAVTLQPGDCLQLDADTAYTVRSGISGYVFYRA